MHVFMQSASRWLNEPMKEMLRKHVPESVFYDDFKDFPKDAETVFEFCDGWAENQHFVAVSKAKNALINAYPSSSALGRKSYLSRVVEYWTAKRPDSILRKHSPVTICLSLDYAEYVDEGLTAADDLTLLYSLEENETQPPERREWWILKPALMDCGSDIRIFSTIDELASHLESADDTDDEEEEDGMEEAPATPETVSDGHSTVNGKPEDKSEFCPTLTTPGLDSLDMLVTAVERANISRAPPGVVNPAKERNYVAKSGRIRSSEIRDFVAQRYITAVLPLEKRKWHVRAYVLAVGRLKVYVSREMLALLARDDYEPPWLNPSLTSSLTNTALQTEEDFMRRESMRDFWALPDDLLPGDGEGKNWKERVFDDICAVSAELFRAAVHTMADKFTTVDKCFELFGVDFLIDEDGTPWLLEANETPAFYHQGVAGPLALRLMESVVLAAMEHMDLARPATEEDDQARKRLIEVLDETNNLAKSNITEILPS